MSDNKKQRNDESGSSSSSPIQNTPSSFLDLRTTHGQVLFLVITVAISSLVQFIPREFVTNTLTVFTSKSTNVCVNQTQKTKPIYWTYGKGANDNHLRHVHLVLERLGFDLGTNETDWDLLWAHDYPFRVFYPKLHQLKPHQKVNHFPGCGYLTNKVDLATSNLKYIPRAFKLPKDKDDFLYYSNKFPNKLFVQKNNQHRDIYVRNITEIDFENNDTFIQEYVDNPLLVDGHKFDIGVYVIITSIDPLRVYVYKGDMLFRYCPIKYYPFDAKILDKYVVGDDYLPTWEVPSLAQYYTSLGFGMKDSFDAYMKTKGKSTEAIWIQVEDAIRTAILAKEKLIADILKKFKSKNNFFEMMRFDLVIDDTLKVHLLEANMSPNLSSAHFLQNTLLYEQVIYNLLNLVGVGSSLHRESLRKSMLQGNGFKCPKVEIVDVGKKFSMKIN
ncbi:putative tubulin polyglutamylase ttll-15 [Pseudolycoriella hygida]|uniref:Tubulin polyglutamylase ttll-15 n=1 Tax=Pseudolycoriella hygida TaxID=35572 RepID=A0A9Q0MWJ4_9DIPT|nr:putative tubulin polyglutamylase ttll-15 [Pseudolycoriella hygida]